MGFLEKGLDQLKGQTAINENISKCTHKLDILLLLWRNNPVLKEQYNVVE